MVKVIFCGINTCNNLYIAKIIFHNMWDACQGKLLTGWGAIPRKKWVVDKAEKSWRSEEYFNIRHGDAVWSCPAGFRSWFSLGFPYYAALLLEWHCIFCALYVGSMWFAFWYLFYRGYR